MSCSFKRPSSHSAAFCVFMCMCVCVFLLDLQWTLAHAIYKGRYPRTLDKSKTFSPAASAPTAIPGAFELMSSRNPLEWWDLFFLKGTQQAQLEQNRNEAGDKFDQNPPVENLAGVGRNMTLGQSDSDGAGKAGEARGRGARELFLKCLPSTDTHTLCVFLPDWDETAREGVCSRECILSPSAA
ncbi:UNVERIFIED_CONTAM: hypothetical protein K2H54_010813 [Gekko kuhli]